MASLDSHNESIFYRFSRHPEAVSNLKLFFHRLCLSDFGALVALTINQCNAAYGKFGKTGKLFSNADVDIEYNKDTIFHFGAIFQDACYMLESYLDNPEVAPSDPQMATILSKLLSYWLDKDQHEVLKTEDKKIYECEWSVRLAEHLFAKLGLSSSYTLDKYSKHTKVKTDICLCGCRKDVSSHYGDTSIGNKKVWHGCIDIILDGCFIPVKVVEEPHPDSPGRKSAIDDKVQDDLEDVAIESQTIAETIVFSFAEKKKHLDFSNFLIPSIGVNKTNIIFHFYDSENDVLLKSRSFKFFYDDDINYMSVLATWFVVNYRYLCSGLTKEHLEIAKKANFTTHADSQLPIYRDELSIGGDVRSEKSKRMCYEPLSFPHCRVCKIPKKEDI